MGIIASLSYVWYGDERQSVVSRGERRVNVGVFLNQYHEPGGECPPAETFEQVSLLESAGFDSVTVGERHLHEEGFIEPITLLAAIAGRTETLELGTAALVPALHDPLRLAEQLAEIDRLSDGRVRFGGALGYRPAELAAFGVEADERVGRFIEAIGLLDTFWEGDHVTHDGDHFTYDDAFVRPAPGSIPIWIGGHADIAIKRAAYRGSGWIASASSPIEELEAQISVYEDALDEFDKDRSSNDVILMRDCFVGETSDQARETIEPHLTRLYEWYARWNQTYMDENDVAVDYDDLKAKFIVGTPTDCIESLEAYDALGVDHVILRVQFPGQPHEPTMDCLQRIGSEVLPAVQ